MESKTNYFIVGLSVLILTAALIIGGLWLSTGFDEKKYHIYTVYMPEAASGLTTESPVKYNGVKVGIINAIELNKFNPQEVKVLLKIEDGTPITTSTHATLIMQGITGTTYLGLAADTASFIPLQKTLGETYPVIPYKPSFFNQLEQNVNELSLGIKRVFDEENAQNIKKTLDNIKEITSVFEKNSASIDESLKTLPQLVKDMKQSMKSFKSMSEDISTAGKQLTNTMQAGRNSIDKISQQAIPPAVVLLRRLNLIAANLEKVSVEMRQNPAVILRGSAGPKLGPGERK